MSVPVTLVSSHANPGGAERYVRDLVAGLGPGWVTKTIALEGGPMVDWLRSDGVPTEVLPTSPRLAGILRSAWKLRRRLSRDEVVHANGVKAALVSTLATLGMCTPVVWVKHDHSWDGWLARLVAWRSAQVVGVSEAVTDTFRGRVRRKVHVVNNGLGAIDVDADAGRRALAELLGPREPVIALVARIDPLKGHRELLAILPELLERFPRLGVAFVGGEHAPHLEFAADLKGELEAAGLEDAVRFAGFRDDVLSLIAASDVVAMPSTVDERGLGREGFPYVGLESMAVGTPVVGYAHGGLPEMLGESGRLVPPGDRAALRDAILELLADDGLRSRLAGEGTVRVRERFSLERMVEEMKGRYREAASAAGIMQDGRERS